MPSTRALLALPAAAVLIAGCGSGPSPADDNAPLTAREFRTQAQQTCRAANQVVERLTKDLKGNPTAEEVKRTVGSTVVVIDNELDALDRLEPPRELSDDVDAMLVSARAAVDHLRSGGPKYVASHPHLFEDANRRATALGLTACAK
jgi:hypothetical protein